MTYTDIENKIIEIIAYHFGVDEKELEGIDTKEALYDKFEPDSLEEIELIMFLEETFDVQFYDDSEFTNWTTLEVMASEIAIKLGVSIADKKCDTRKLQKVIERQEREIKALQEELNKYSSFRNELRNFINL